MNDPCSRPFEILAAQEPSPIHCEIAGLIAAHYAEVRSLLRAIRPGAHGQRAWCCDRAKLTDVQTAAIRKVGARARDAGMLACFREQREPTRRFVARLASDRAAVEFAQGGWLEVYAFSVLRDAARASGVREPLTATNVHVAGPGGTAMEIDALLVAETPAGRRTLAVECKTGRTFDGVREAKWRQFRQWADPVDTVFLASDVDEEGFRRRDLSKHWIVADTASFRERVSVVLARWCEPRAA